MTNEEYISDKLQEMGRYVDGQIPINYAFVLLVFPFGPDGVIQYVANADRGDVVQVMREWIAMIDEQTYGTDQGDAAKEPFDRCWAAEIRRLSDRQQTVRQIAYDAFVAGMSQRK
jgi:hypothetical protein